MLQRYYMFPCCSAPLIEKSQISQAALPALHLQSVFLHLTFGNLEQRLGFPPTRLDVGQSAHKAAISAGRPSSSAILAVQY